MDEFDTSNSACVSNSGESTVINIDALSISTNDCDLSVNESMLLYADGITYESPERNSPSVPENNRALESPVSSPKTQVTVSAPEYPDTFVETFAETSTKPLLKKRGFNSGPSTPASPLATEEWLIDPVSLNHFVKLIMEQQNMFALRFTQFQNTFSSILATQTKLDRKISDMEANLIHRIDRKTLSQDESWQSSFSEMKEDFETKFQSVADENSAVKTIWEEHMGLIRENLNSANQREEDDRSSQSSSSTSNRDNDNEIESLKVKLYNLDCRIDECEQYSVVIAS